MVVLRRLLKEAGLLTGMYRDRYRRDSPVLRCLSALDAWREAGAPVDGTARSYRFGGGVTCRLRGRVMDDASVVIQSLRAGRSRQGAGSAALRLICQVADTHGVTLVLDAIPFVTEAVPVAMSPAELAGWYGRFGFVPTGSTGMRRPAMPLRESALAGGYGESAPLPAVLGAG